MVVLLLLSGLLGVDELLFLLGGRVFVQVADHVDGERGHQRLGLACVDRGANAGGLGFGLLLRAGGHDFRRAENDLARRLVIVVARVI